MDTKTQLLEILDEALCLQGRPAQFDVGTPLMGVLPELDSMAVIALINLIEERFGVIVGEDEVDASTFATVGTLLAYVNEKLSSAR